MMNKGALRLLSTMLSVGTALNGKGVSFYESTPLRGRLKRYVTPNPPRQHFFRGHYTKGVTLYGLTAAEFRYLQGLEMKHNPSGSKLWRKVERRMLTISHPR